MTAGTPPRRRTGQVSAAARPAEEPLFRDARAQLANELRSQYEHQPDLTIVDLAATVPYSYHVVRKLLLEAGTTIRHPQGGHDRPPVMTTEQLVQLGTALRHFYLTGESKKSLVQLASRSQLFVNRALKAVGIDSKAPKIIEPSRKITAEELTALGHLIGPRYINGASMDTLSLLINRKSSPLIRAALVAADYPIRRSKYF